ncbi:hypothetical protein PQQ51_15135 [Paraburkholderia xenovorans]|uniref:hypothetical protein n=1 Tax=Paraburkholderia xenovorans TaxID=36873 RepID=UPI0038BB81FD
MTLDQSQQIEEVLLNWYRWQIRQSHAELLAHYYRSEDRACRDYQTPLDEDELTAEAYEWADDQLAMQVDTAMDDLSHRGTLTSEMRAAISISLRNKMSGCSVWSTCRSDSQHATYQAAKKRLLPMLVLRGLIREAETASSVDSADCQ